MVEYFPGDQTGERPGDDGGQNEKNDPDDHDGFELGAGHGRNRVFPQKRRQRSRFFDHLVKPFLVDADNAHQAENGEDTAAGQAAQCPGQHGVAFSELLIFLAEQIDRQSGTQGDPEHEKQVEQVQARKD